MTYPKLWRYNLHYFDWLKDSNVDHIEQASIIDSWIENNPMGKEDAWEPYTASLRIVNWVRYFGKRQELGLTVSNHWLASLAVQCRWLSKNMEYHIRANHLFKNWVALVIGSLYLDGCFSNSKIQRILTNFEQELVEQFTRDGGHYERSPMYHCIALEDLIDVYQSINEYLKVNGIVEKVTPNFKNQLSLLKSKLGRYIENGFDYLRAVTLIDGKISLMADSAFAIASEPSDLRFYWRQVKGLRGIDGHWLNNKPVFSKHLEKSGYVRKTTSQYDVLVNVGEPAPSYQPGHTHCDLFSFELVSNSHKENRLFVDTGVFQYGPGELRTACRKTSAHNTAQLESLEQHQIWGEFRVGARAHVTALNWESNKQSDTLEVSHDGFSRHYSGVIHRRFFEMSNSIITVSDEITAPRRQLKKIADPLTMTSRLHLGPEYFVSGFDEKGKRIHIQRRKDIAVAIRSDNVYIATISYDSECTIKKAKYFPEFGISVEIDCICFESHKKLPNSIVYSINFY
ncbi:MAG: heparinase II/III family protein [Pseudomonadales bacterium]|nr:heparinase II/III family protein [Pseudomonadales bacterium]